MSSAALCFVRSSFKFKFPVRMSSSNLSYENAVHKLNTLQSNKHTIEQIRRDIKTGKKCTNIEDMENYLPRTGLTLSQLDNLSVIHVAGTKGKGSTSAMCESILRHHGFKTGFFSSPHLVSVCERIRLNGQIISKDKFAAHFHQVYDMLDNTKEFDGDMPKYFAFLTVLAYNIFLKEKVDVAIVEVGIGGVVDYTNVLRKVPVVGITALGLDHTSILGNTIAEIAEAKAGIMKPGCETYTVIQPPNAMNVLYKVAREVKCHLHIVPDYKTYHFPRDMNSKLLPIDLEAYYMNASLAIQLAHAWIRGTQLERKVPNIHLMKGRMAHKNGYNDIGKPIINIGYKIKEYSEMMWFVKDIPLNTMLGLKNCKWPGRYQILRSDYAQFYLDGAHTKESMEICVKWFTQHKSINENVLIFSATGDRDSEILLKPLTEINFQTVFFVIPTAYKQINKNNDNYTTMEQNELIARCYKHATIWNEKCNSSSNVIVLDCVSNALKHLKLSSNNVSSHSVLVTGSLHLVGAALSILDPNLNSS